MEQQRVQGIPSVDPAAQAEQVQSQVPDTIPNDADSLLFQTTLPFLDAKILGSTQWSFRSAIFHHIDGCDFSHTHTYVYIASMENGSI